MSGDVVLKNFHSFSATLNSETQYKPSGPDAAGRPNSTPQLLDQKINEVHDITCDNSERSLFELKSDFIANTNLHGLRHVFKGNTPHWLRFIWLVLLLTSASYYFISVFDGIEKYFNYPISTVVTTKYPDSMDFPAVTICPLNLLKKGKIMISDGDPDFKKLGLNVSACEATSAVRNGRPCGHALLCCCSSLMLVTNASSLVENCTEDYGNKIRRVIEKTPSILNLTKYFQIYSQNIQDLFVWCQFGMDSNGSECDANHFKQIVTNFGACYTFNSKQPGFALRKTQFSGAAAGLTLILDIDVLEHTVGLFSEGLRILVHSQGEYVSALWNGINVQPGTSASIAVSMQKRNSVINTPYETATHFLQFLNLKRPYRTKCEHKVLRELPTYTTEGCDFECFSNYTMVLCKCQPVGTTGVSEMRVCNDIDRSCLDLVSENFQREYCDCPVPCQLNKYSAEVSYSKFPDASTARFIKKSDPKYQNFTLQELRENLVLLQVGYKSLSFEEQEQTAAYDLGAMFGQLGGNMGMFLGCSLLTLAEFAQFIAYLVAWKYCT